MNSIRDARFRLAPGVDVVRLGEDKLLFCSDTTTIRVEGAFARVLFTRVLPLLDGRRSVADVTAELLDLPSEVLGQRLADLARADVLVEDLSSVTAGALPVVRLAMAVGIRPDEALERLSSSVVGIFGLEGHGAHLAVLLGRCGVGHLVLADPFPCQAGNLPLMPSVTDEALGVPRQDVVHGLVAEQASCQVTTAGDELTRERVAQLAASCTLMVACFDRAFSSANHWVNRAGLSQGIASLHAEARGLAAWLGPAVLPGKTACYMCYRMRRIACEEDFTSAMAYEEHLDALKDPALHQRLAFPQMSSFIASVLAMEIVRYVVGIDQPSLAGRVLEFNGLTLESLSHPVVQVPDCPVCGPKKKSSGHPGLPDLRKAAEARADLLSVADLLVSPKTGIVRELEQIDKDPSEPHTPFVLRARVANHRFLSGDVQQQLGASGRGMTREEARASALGEAVERYSAGSWTQDEIIYGRRPELGAGAIDPRSLVLYASDQYATLPYQPYADDSVLGWVRAHSLVQERESFIPALSALLSYQPLPGEYLFSVTSNGLAAGSSLLQAVHNAVCEVLERDAFLTTWMNKLPASRWDPMGHPDAGIATLCEAYRRRGVGIELYRLPTDHPCQVFVALALGAEGSDDPAVVLGLGADLDARAGARKAILEVGQIRPALRVRMRSLDLRRRIDELVEDPQRVKTLEDHELLYCSRRTLRAFDFLRSAPMEAGDWSAARARTPADKLQALIDHTAATGGDVLYAELTPPDIAALGLHVVRAILPGFQPIAFGAAEARLGGHRLYELPRRLGLRKERTTRSELNPDPHPLA